MFGFYELGIEVVESVFVWIFIEVNLDEGTIFKHPFVDGPFFVAFGPRGFSCFLGIVYYVSFVLLKFVFFPSLGEGGFDEFVPLEVVVPVSEPVWPSVSVCVEAIPNQTIVSCGTVIIGRSFF